MVLTRVEMIALHIPQQRSQLVYLIVLTSLLLALFWVYSVAYGLQFSFDDLSNLQRLDQVHDIDSALVFVFSGHAGPTGRPIALFSFLLNTQAWPDNPDDFLFINVLIHLLNTLLVFIVLRRMLCLSPKKIEDAEWIALLTAALWALSPLLASTSLNLVQRMTSLSASFMLIGMWIYLIGRAQVVQRPKSGLFLMATGIGAGTVLATYTKESGALLPVYLLAAELTLLRVAPLPSSRIALWSARALVWIPTGILVWYLITHNFQGGYATRPFTQAERVITEWIILWDYIRQAFLPNVETMGIFHDDYPVYSDLLDPAVLISLGGWTAALMLAVLFRRDYPPFSFAVFWYLGGHLLESTVIGLELYFEHRNYLPLLGPYFLLVYSIWHLSARYRVLSRSLLLAYIGVQGYLLWQVCSLWGQPLQAAQAWYVAHPDSRRAIQHLASSYVHQHEIAAAHKLIVDAADRHPELTDLQIQSLQLGCAVDSEKAFQDRFATVISRLSTGQFSNATLAGLNQLSSLYLSDDCPQIDVSQIHALTDELRLNPAYSSVALAQYHLHYIDARLFTAQRLFNPMLYHLEQAFLSYPNIDSALYLALTLRDAGFDEKALAFLDTAIEYAPSNPVLKNEWLEKINAFRSGMQ